MSSRDTKKGLGVKADEVVIWIPFVVKKGAEDVRLAKAAFASGESKAKMLERLLRLTLAERVEQIDDLADRVGEGVRFDPRGRPKGT